MKLIDAHTHIHFPAYGEDRADVIARAEEKGIGMICVGTNTETSQSAIDLAKQYSGQIWATVGFHPNHAVPEQWYADKNESDQKREDFDRKRILELAKQSAVVAIGECGLDYYRLASHEKEIKEKQKEVFLAQIAIAQDVQKPLMIHCRPTKGTNDAYEDLYSVLQSVKNRPEVVLHFYVGGPEVTKKFVEAGYHFTFGGVITFARDYDHSIAQIPLERIMLETDAPYVAPASQRGKRNESSFLEEIAQKLAELKGIGYDEVAKQTTENARRVFKLNG
ncbi:MAG: TatD family hydrolase [Candidatus Harrisonbacteria bacterium]|nr:TatD family hydrolase [Candidatus Harrisonbacteria bacterium]